MRQPGRSSPSCAAHAAGQITRCQGHRQAAPAQPGLPPVAVPFADNRGNPAQELKAANPAARSDTASSAAAVRSGTGSERRQLTIMACNMVDSMALSARLDPEDMRDLIASFHKVVADVVSRFDGFVAQYLGDGVLVYFGYPAAHEHDTEQAVRAGLAILDAVGTLKAASGVPLQARVGIATGLVVVGEQLGTGDTAAARCDRRDAKPGGAAAGRGSARRGRHCGQHAAAGGADVRLPRAWCDEVKGLPQPVEAWQVRGETAGVSRFEARRAGRAVAARWPAGGDRAAAAPLGSGQARRGSGRAALGRARHRQVAHR